MIQPDKQAALVPGQIIRVCEDEECTRYRGYAALIEPMDEGTTLIEGQENEFDNDWVFIKQRWRVQFLKEEDLPHFCTKEETFTQKYVQETESFVYLYEYIGKWRELKHEIIENDTENKTRK